jgi:hypothetical protein
MKKILLKNKKILAVIAVIVIIPLIYLFFFHDKKEYFICKGKLPDNRELSVLWIFDVKKKIGYRDTLEYKPFPIKVYSDMYTWDNTSYRQDRRVDLYYTFYKRGLILNIKGKVSYSAGEIDTVYQCKKM